MREGVSYRHAQHPIHIYCCIYSLHKSTYLYMCHILYNMHSLFPLHVDFCIFVVLIVSQRKKIIFFSLSTCQHKQAVLIYLIFLLLQSQLWEYHYYITHTITQFATPNRNVWLFEVFNPQTKSGNSAGCAQNPRPI